MKGCVDYMIVLRALLTQTSKVDPVRNQADDTVHFQAIVRQHGAAIERLCLGYEASSEARRDLYQDILAALWRALPSFEARCSVKTWVYRIAHNVAASHVIRARRRAESRWQSLDDLDDLTGASDGEASALSHLRLEALANAIRKLNPLDRQLVLLFLEGFSPGEIADVTGLSNTNVSTKLSRLRALLRDELEEVPSP